MELKDLEPKLAELKSAIEGNITKSVKDQLTAELKSVTDAIAEIKAAQSKPDEAITAKVDALQATITELKTALDANQPVIDAFVHNKSKDNGPAKLKTFEQVLASAIEEKTDEVNKFARKETKSLVIDLKAVGDMSTSNVTGGSRYGQIFAPNIIQNPYRKVHVRDLLPTRSVGPGNTYTFMKENGDGEGAIAPVAEGATKPQIDLDLIEATVNFETLAGWLRITRKAMNNIPGLIGWLQQRLPEKLMRIEDAQILYGDGVSPNLKGIGTAGNFTAATSTSGELEEKIIDALSQLEDSLERYPTGIVVRPAAYWNFFKNKAAGSGEYDLPKNFVFADGMLRVSGVPVIPTTAVNSGDYFVGDWMEGAELLIQENMRLEFFEQDGTNVRENKITVRIEETVALPVYGATYFVKGTDSDQS